MIWVMLSLLAGLSLSVLIVINQLEGRRKQLDRQAYKDYWQTKVMVNLEDQGKYQLAVIEADKLLDKALKESGFRGQTMGERLVEAGPALSNKDAVWEAHKLRNRLVHETDVKVSLLQAKRMLAVFARALKDVGAL